MIAVFYENILTGAIAEHMRMPVVVAALKARGLDAVYISDETLKDRIHEVHSVLRSTGVAVAGLHAWIDFSSNPANQSYRFLIDEAVRLKADNVLIVPGMESPENIVAGMRAAVKYGDVMGIRVCMEPLDRLDSPYNNIAGLEYFLDSVPGLYCCFDTGNLILRGEDELAAFGRVKDRVIGLHLKDRTWEKANVDDAEKVCADGRTVYPAPVGDGVIRMEEILDAADSAATLPLIIELYDYSPAHILDGICRSLEWVKKQH